MSSDPDEIPEAVGYGKPPKAHQFKKGISGNPKGRPKAKSGAQDISGLLNETIKVMRNGKVEHIGKFEAYIRKLVARALIERKLDAMIRFLDLCEEFQLIKPSETVQTHGVLYIPKDWDHDEWLEHFHEYGPPPFPGKRTGLVQFKNSDCDETPGSLETEAACKSTQPKAPRKRKFKRRLTKQEVLGRIANEQPVKARDSEDHGRTILILVIKALEQKMFESNARAARRYNLIEERYGTQPISLASGFLLFPEPLSAEEWEKKADEGQRKYRSAGPTHSSPN